MPLSLLKNIPPERIGLHGEYDHSGLAKRVKFALRERFGAQFVDRLHVSQRGRVVIFVGDIATRQMVKQLMELALSIEGAAFVEIHDFNSLQSDAA